MPTSTITLQCPNCSRPAEATLRRGTDATAGHAEVLDFRCPAGCRVDDESIRQVSGTSTN